MVSKKGFEPSRPKARAPKTLVAAISPLRDRTCLYAINDATDKASNAVAATTPSSIGRRFTIDDDCGDRIELAVHDFHRIFRPVHLTATRSRPAQRHQTHNPSFSACPFLGYDRRRNTYSFSVRRPSARTSSATA